MLKNKGHNKIDNDRAAKREKRKINKIHPYGRGADAQYFAQPLAHAKSFVLKPTDNAFNHITNIRKINYVCVPTKQNPMLQKILCILLLLFIFTSCKKNYTCNCSTVAIYLGADGKFYTLAIRGSTTPYTKKLKKKQAEEACKATEVTLQSSTANWFTANNWYPLQPGESFTSFCALTY